MSKDDSIEFEGTILETLPNTVFRVKLEPGLSANPYFSFYLKATKTGPVDFWWKDQDGTETTATATLTVT